MLLRKWTSECRKKSKGGKGIDCTFSFKLLSEFEHLRTRHWHLCPAVSRDGVFAYRPSFLSLFCPLTVHASISSTLLFSPSSSHLVIWQKKNQGCLCFYVNMLTGTMTSLEIYTSLSIYECVLCVLPAGITVSECWTKLPWQVETEHLQRFIPKTKSDVLLFKHLSLSDRRP